MEKKNSFLFAFFLLFISCNTERNRYDVLPAGGIFTNGGIIDKQTGVVYELVKGIKDSTVHYVMVYKIDVVNGTEDEYNIENKAKRQ